MSSNSRPRHNPLLWASLHPSAGDEREINIPSIPIVPENKINTSLRVVLHDTKATLEQFSDRLGKLVSGVEQAKRDIDKAGKNFDEGHDKVLDELNAVINRSQKGLLEVLGTPAQSAVLEEVKNAQAASDRKLDALENRTDLVHKQLQALSEQQGHLLTQQGHILTSLATITPLPPLLKDLPQQQTQVLSSLTALMALQPLLEALPAQIKASQQEALESFMTSINNDRSIAFTSPQLPVRSAEQSTSSDIPQHHPLNLKHPREENSREDHPSEDTAACNIPQRQTASSHTKESSSAFGKPFSYQFARPNIISSNSNPVQSLPPSSDAHTGFSSFAPTHEVPAKGCKRPRLEGNSDEDVPQKDIPASDTGTSTIPSSSTLRSDTSDLQHAQHVRSRPFRIPAPPPVASTSSHAPNPALTSTAPTPHAPGSYVQPRYTVPGRLLAATSHILNRTPTPPPRNSHSRRQTRNSRNLVSSNAIAPSSPPFKFPERRNAPELSPSSDVQVSNLVGGHQSLATDSTRLSGNALNDVQVYASGSGSSVHQPLIRVRPLTALLLPDTSTRFVPVQRNSQPKIILDDDTDIDLDWGDMGPG